MTKNTKIENNMVRNILVSAAAFLLCTAVQAQQNCRIKGVFSGCDSLRYTARPVSRVYLAKADALGNFETVDSAEVVNRRFEFSRALAGDEPALIYLITGFDNGAVNLFVEPGEVFVDIRDARFPAGALVSGTYNNDVMHAYRKIQDDCVVAQIAGMKAFQAQHPDMDATMQNTVASHLGGKALLQSYAEILRFCAAHSDSAYVPLLLERQMMYVLSPETCEKWLARMVSPALHGHPYYKSLENAIFAQNLRIGSKVPDIELPLRDGTAMRLGDLRGKYVFLDFWASWCAPCRREIPYLMRVWEQVQKRDDFAIVSFSLDNKADDWTAAIRNMDMDHAGWIHASDLYAWNSPAVRALRVTAVPRSVLIDPEGRVLAFDLRGEELVGRVSQLLSGLPQSMEQN